MAKQEEKAVHKGALLCPSCNTEFVGTECPDCGNRKGNVRLATDGIDQNLHTQRSIFADNTNFVTAADAEIGLMQSRQAAAQIQEFNENMRDTYVFKSEIKKKELELERMKKDAQIREQKALLESGQSVLNRGQPQNQNVHQDQSGMMNTPFMGMNPQTAFMSQLMKMDKDKRSDFLTQLSEADPQALSVLGSMMAPAQPFNQNQMNPMSMPGFPQSMNPYMTPYMQQMQMALIQQQSQQQQQHQQPARESAEDSLTTALTLVGAIQDMMSKNAPKTDDTMKEFIREMREEQKELRRKLDERSSSSSGDILRPLVEEMSNIKNMVISNSKKPGISETLTEINTLVDGLEKSGLVSRSGSGERSVDDQIKMKKLDHQIATDDKTLALEAQKIESEKARLNIGQAMMASIMNRSFKKNTEPQSSDRSEPVIKSASRVNSRTKLIPPEIVENHVTDGGTVAEIKSASVKSQVI